MTNDRREIHRKKRILEYAKRVAVRGQQGPDACPSGSAPTPATSRAAHTTGARIALGGAAGAQQGAQNNVKSCNLKDKSKIHSAGRDQSPGRLATLPGVDPWVCARTRPPCLSYLA